jgi:hypothetical protein
MTFCFKGYLFYSENDKSPPPLRRDPELNSVGLTLNKEETTYVT